MKADSNKHKSYTSGTWRTISNLSKMIKISQNFNLDISIFVNFQIKLRIKLYKF
jgi:hypothetical protein